MLKRIPYISAIVFAMFLHACNPTKYVPRDEYLLNSYRIEVGEGKVNRKELREYIKQTPNKKIFFWRFYLSLYNLSEPGNQNGFHDWLRRIGEPPVIYDERQTQRSAEQLRLFMRNKGYYHAEVSDTTTYRDQLANVVYMVEPNRPYRIGDITYFFQDASLSELVLRDTAAGDFRSGEPLDVDILEEERIRIEELLRNNGYFSFNRDFIYFQVDTSQESFLADVTLGIRNYPVRSRNGRTIHVDHPTYAIGSVSLVTDHDPMMSRSMRDSLMSLKDTVVYDSVRVISTGDPNIRPAVVTQKNEIIPGDLYSEERVRNTYRNLSSLSAFRMVDVRFTEVSGKSGLLDCRILAAPATRQSYTVKVEGTNSGGNIGAAGNLSYRHRNLFGGSETFNLSFIGAIETLNRTSENDTSRNLNLMQEFGVEARLRIPKFLLPFRTDQFIRRFNPQTNLRLSYNYQKRPDYIRTLANASFGYEWKGNRNLTHRVYPLEASLILTPFKSRVFEEWLEGKYLFYSYEPHLIVDSRYSMVFTNQKLLMNQDFQDVRINLETAGNLLYGGYTLFAEEPSEGKYQLFGVDYAQYLKADVDLRSYNFLYEDVSLVFRGFAGVGYAYLNSTAMPFEKQYFSGGANSVRAWQVKSLGPGSYRDSINLAYPNQTGDVKLEANLEYRFRLFWKVEAALFLDAGNIWSLSEEDDREGAGFEFGRFYREMALGTGVGTRFVFSFFVFRLDVGFPLRNPYRVSGSYWLPDIYRERKVSPTFNIAIGYPF